MISVARVGVGLAALAVLSFAPMAGAQSSAVHKTTLQDRPFPAPQYHTATVRTVVDPGGQVMPHTHPGLEVGYVLGGRAVVKISGLPPLSLSAGDSFAVPRRTVHSVENTGPGALTILSTYVVDKDQPIASPAP